MLLGLSLVDRSVHNAAFDDAFYISVAVVCAINYHNRS